MDIKSFRRTLIVVGMAAGLGLSAVAFAESDESSTSHSGTVGAAITDTAITAKVKSKFIGVDRLKHADISVTTNNGIVTLTGSAPGSNAKSTAETIARSVDGVKRVDDDLKTPSAASDVSSDTRSVASDVSSDTHKVVKTTKRVASDSWITTKVKSEIAADSLSKGFKVSVTTKHGVVVLSGTLTSRHAIDHVKEIAEKVHGVRRVDTSALKIGST